MEKAPEKAIVLLSGGLDSTVALAKALDRYEILLTVTFNYGQRSFGKEMKASRTIANHYNLPNEIIPLPWLSQRLPRDMAYVPSGCNCCEEEVHEDKTHAESSYSEEFSVEQVWVPNRNGLFLNIGATLAEAHDASVIIFGANAEEGENFPDNTPAFRDHLNQVFQYSTLNHVRVETPVGHMRKREIIEEGLALNAPLNLVWSCYGMGPLQCGRCPSCKLLKNALSEVPAAAKEKQPAIAFQR